MKNIEFRFAFLPVVLAVLCPFAARAAAPAPSDWLIDPAPFKAQVRDERSRHELVLENGLTRRTIRLTPNAATVDYQSLVTGEQLLRAMGPEARVTIGGVEYAVGGLTGQLVKNYLKADWIEKMQTDPAAYRFTDWKEEPLAARFAWKKRPEWLSRDLPWPPPGKQVTLRFVPPAQVPEKTPKTAAGLPEIDIHYAIYDGIPLIEKWLTVRNTTPKPVRVNKTIVETLQVEESESATEPNINWEPSSLYVETDYAYLSMNGKSANKHSVRWLPDHNYSTQVNYDLQTPCVLECGPEFGPDTDVAPGEELTSIRCFELLRDGTDRERRGLAQRRMYRTIAPWTQENPVMVHLISSDPAAIRKIVDQAADVGVELIILSFGSGVNLESTDPNYWAKYKAVADYARARGIAIGGYSLLASRGAATAADNCGGPGARIRYGVMPCLGSNWGRQYLRSLQDFFTHTGFGLLEHDGSYPGDTCAHTDHPGHHGLDDSQWMQFRAIAAFYQWCRAKGIYLNVPDWYFLNGSSKCGMNYRESNWSLPRDEQEIIERQNVYDGTWEKTDSMGWMFVPLTQYQGGGAAATIEPLKDHLPHYEARLANLFGAGVQACYRGPRIYDTDATKAVVKKWIGFYKAHREVLDADLVHLRRPDGRDWDGFLHVNPQGREKGLAMFYNPLAEPIERDIRVPLYYSGLSEKAAVSINDGPASVVPLDRHEIATIHITIPARGRIWTTFERP
jgi:hypothetical protein